MAKKNKLSFDDFKYECMEFYRQRYSYYGMSSPSIMDKLRGDSIDRKLFYFRIYINGGNTSKILMYDRTLSSDRPFAVYEEWIDSLPYVNEPQFNEDGVCTSCAQLILLGEYKTIEEAFSNMCERSPSWRWSVDAIVNISFPELTTLDDYYSEEFQNTLKYLLPSGAFTLSKYVDVINEHSLEMFKGTYEVYVTQFGMAQSFFTFINK